MMNTPSIRIHITAEACIAGALFLLILPLHWLLSALATALIHELCHLLLLKLCGVTISDLTIRTGGAVITTGHMDPWQEFLSALAGPVGSLLTFFIFLDHAPVLSLCAGMQGIYNLLPLLPLDGGRILWCLLGWLFPRHRRSIMFLIRCCLSLIFCLLGLYTIIRTKAWMLSLPIIFLLLRKIPCKDGQERVQ